MTDPAADLRRFCDLPAARLLDLFRGGTAAAPPDGPAEGLMLLLPGTKLARPLAAAIRGLVWQGKTFDAAGGRLINRVLPFGLRAVPARIHRAASRLDGRPCLVLDYRRSSWIAWPLRDEIRELAPGLWLGLVWCGRLRLGAFALSFPDAG